MIKTKTIKTPLMMAEAYGPTYCTSAHVLESKLSHKPEAQYGFVPKLIHHGGKTPCFALKGLIYKTFAVIVDVSTDTRRIKTSEEGFLRFLLTTETSKIKRLFSLTFLCLFALMAVAQDYTALVSGKEKKGSDTSLSRPLQAGVLFGVGYSNQLDTYLSPMEYTGYQLSFLTSRERFTKWADGNVSFQSLFQGVYSHTQNPARTATAWGGRLAYDAGWHYHWRLSDRLSLKAGGLLGADLGFLYNARNSNNPAQGRLGIDISASAGGCYKFNIRKLPVRLNYQADLPLMGCMFSPQFGQSYYDISEGSRDHNVCFSHPGNALCFRQLLTLDLEFSRASLRFGYMGDVRQSHVNGIRMHDVGHSFMIGYVRYLKILKRNER